MQFIPNGPDIPERLLQAHEDGRVVFFCGAGISYPAALPGFGGLVSRIYGELGESPSSIELAAQKSAAFDTTIGLLEGRVVGHRQAVRKAIAKILTPDLTRRNALATHDALLTLSRNGDDRIRLITTNFDRLFVEAARRQKIELPHYCAPLLPVPKKKWDGLVYLHGLLPELAAENDLERLIVSSGDFGIAYLTERWAARFVSELFRTYTVCFVGYSINDPVLRYMMDALAADRLLGENPPEAYAFGNYAQGQEQAATDEWLAKNVTPILYRNRNHHTYLHTTLRAWADTYRDGVRGKESIVARHAVAKPLGSTKQDNFVGRMLWAINDPSGLPAKKFADFNPRPPIEWLDAFTDARFGHGDLLRFGVTADDKADEKLSYSLVERPSPYTLAPWMRLVFRTHNHDGGCDSVMLHIARWLARHLDSPRLLLWVADRGSVLRDNFAYLILEELEKNPPPPQMAAYWRMVLSGRLQDTSLRRDFYTWSRRLKSEGLTTGLRMQFREILAPRIRFRQTQRATDGDVHMPTIDWELVLASEHMHTVIKGLSDKDFWQNALPLFLSDATDLLRDGMDIMRELGAADDDSDRSYYQQPSIAKHAQNRGYRDWTVLIELVRDSWIAAPAEIAVREVGRWGDFRYPIFRRLTFFALAERLELFGADKALEFLLARDGYWLWAIETQHEAIRLISALAPVLSDEQSSLLQIALLKGPTQNWKDIKPESFQGRADREIWRRLTTFQQAGGALIAEALNKLSDISVAHPNWGVAQEKDRFPVWMDSSGLNNEREAAPVLRRELEAWLEKKPGLRGFHEEDDWRERCRKDFPRTVVALLLLAEKGVWPVDRWRQALQAWSDEALASRSWRCVGPRFNNAPNEVFSTLQGQISWWLEACARHARGAEDVFFPLVYRILNLEHAIEEPISDQLLMTAMNHPVGHVTEAALKLWYEQGLEDGQGLQGEFAKLFTLLCDKTNPAFLYGRLFLSVNAITLFRVDEEWAKENLLDLFDWHVSTETAKAAWTGFLWSPRLYWPLLRSIKASFLATADHYAELGEHGDQYAGLLTFAALEADESITRSEFAAATAALPETGRLHVIQTVTDGLESAGSKKTEYWQNRVKPYLRYVWPKSQQWRTPQISSAFARLVVTADEMFPDALDTLKDWLQKTEHADYSIHLLSESQLSARFPDEALQFLDLVFADSPAWGAGEVLACLTQIRGASPELASDRRFIRIEVILRRAGLI